MMPKLPWWLILLVAPMAWWNRLRNNPFLVQVALSYAAHIGRFAVWAVVIAVVYRGGEGKTQLALLLLVRGTVGILSYCSAGLLPVLVPRLQRVSPVVSAETGSTQKLDYAPSDEQPPGPPKLDDQSPEVVYGTASTVVLLLGAAGIVLASVYGFLFPHLHEIGGQFSGTMLVVLWVAIGVLARAGSDVPGAMLHANHRIGLDSLCQLSGEVTLLATVLFLRFRFGGCGAGGAAIGIAAGGVVTALARSVAARRLGVPRFSLFRRTTARLLLTGGALVLLGQVADWLYAPMNMVLIDRFMPANTVATYGVAIQVDAAMLLLVSGLATVLFPYAARAMHVRNFVDLRLIYVGGTLLSLIILTLSAVVICLIDGWLFKVWFGDPLPATQAILPLVMVHTVAGGSASIGRSVLFGMGKFKAYAISAILGGGANVALAILFLTTTSLGLRGIIYATIITVVVRCLIWMPVYTLWSIYKIGGPMRIRWH